MRTNPKTVARVHLAAFVNFDSSKPMPNYRRAFIPGGTYFFTLVTEDRAPIFNEPFARDSLGRIIRECRDRWPFQVEAMVLLPDHLHAILSLPSGDDAYSRRWGWIKKEFTKAWLDAGGPERTTSSSRRRQRRRGVWQRRFWEHQVRDETSLERLADYVHFNPVKHGYASCPSDWVHSTFARWVRLGTYPDDWGCASHGPLNFDDVASSVEE